MDCRDIRESISVFVDGEASPGEAASVRDHLASCGRCRALERQMRAVGAGVRQVRVPPPDRFREKVFARLESEGALPKRTQVFPPAWRWAVPLAAAAGLGLFLFASREAVRAPVPHFPVTSRVETSAPVAPVPGSPVPVPAVPPPPAQGIAATLSADDREMLALLDILEDPAAFDANDEAEGMDLLAPGDTAASPSRRRGGRGGA